LHWHGSVDCCYFEPKVLNHGGLFSTEDAGAESTGAGAVADAGQVQVQE